MGRQFCNIPFWPCLFQEHQFQTPNIFAQNNLWGCWHAISLHHPSVLFLLPTHFVLSNSTIESKMSHSLGRWEARIKIMLLLETSPCKHRAVTTQIHWRRKIAVWRDEALQHEHVVTRVESSVGESSSSWPGLLVQVSEIKVFETVATSHLCPMKATFGVCCEPGP